jgi:hypothetical protein
MGAPDQTLDKDAHASILDDSRRLTPVDIDSYSGAGQGHNDEAYDTTLVLRFIDGQLVPDTLHVHTRGFTVTKWESMYSTIWSDPNWRDTPWSTTKLAPVVDDSYCVIGYAGWIDGLDLCVATETCIYDPVRDERLFWKFLEELRLSRLQGQALAIRETERRFSVAVQGRAAEANRPIPMSPAPQIWESNEVRYRNNINYFLSGGGKAVVGERFDEFNYTSYLGQILNNEKHGYAKYARTSGYRFLVLVNPEGYVQAVLDAEVVPPQTFGEKALEFALGIIDVVSAILLVVDIVTIPVVLLRAGLVVARGVAIRAIKLVASEFTKAVETIAERDVQALLKMARAAHFSAEGLKAAADSAAREVAEAALRRGAMSGPERAEARTAWAKLKREFWEAGNTPPMKKFTEDEAAKLNKQISDRMTELGIPKKNQGAGIRRLPPKGEKPPPGTKGMQPFMDENGKAFNPTGSTRGGRMRSGSYDPRYGGDESGISVHGNVFNDWKGFELWNKSSVADRIDATIAHEWSEFNGLSHWETVQVIPETKLAISQRAKELLRYMRMMGEPDVALTEFTKAEWEAIKAAGKATAPFEEKLKIAMTLAAQGK